MVGNETPSGAKTPTSVVTVRPKRPASGTWSLTDGEETGKKRARFWLGDKAENAIVVGEDDDDGDDVEFLGQNEKDKEKDAQEESETEHRGFSGLSDTGSESPCKGRGGERERSVSAVREVRTASAMVKNS